MRFIRLVSIQLEYYLFRWRWWLSIVVALLIAWWGTDALHVHVMNYGGQPNVWDVFFRIWTDYHFHFFVSNLLFLVLAGDIAVPTPWEDTVLLRVRSRWQWWISKVTVLVICVAVYLLVFLGATFALAGANFPWKTSWSTSVYTFSTEWHINAALFRYTPLQAFGQTLLLLALGWFSLGLLAAVLSLATRAFVWGLIGSIGVNFVGLVMLLEPVSAPYAFLSFPYHLLINYHAFGDPGSAYPSMQVSLWYWIVVIAALVGVGLSVSRRQDFMRYAP